MLIELKIESPGHFCPEKRSRYLFRIRSLYRTDRR